MEYKIHTFAYYRVSTGSQTNENQDHELRTAGYQPDQVYRDQISGKIPAAERPEFSKLLDTIARTQPPKRLICTKIDRLGRDAADILGTVKRLAEMDCSVKILQFGDMDLTSVGGKLVLAVLAALAEGERDIIIERTNAGIARARANGVTFGRPRVVDAQMEEVIAEHLACGTSISAIARETGVSRATVGRVRESLLVASC